MEGINPKQAFGQAKPPHSTVPLAVLAEVGVGMFEGSRKYGRHNYRVTSILASVYYDATRRHLDSWFEGEDTDPDSGLSHITKAICSLVVLRDSMINGMLADDRPPPVPASHKQYLQSLTNEIAGRWPDPKQPFTRDDVLPKAEMIEIVGIEGMPEPPLFGYACPGFVNAEAYPGAFADLDELHGNDVHEITRPSDRYELLAPRAGTLPDFEFDGPTHFGYHRREPVVNHPLVGDADDGSQ